MFHKFYPDKCVDSAYTIDYEELYRRGYRGILFDIDNTLVEHGANASAQAISLFRKLKKIGFETCLISNNKEPRVMRFNAPIGTNYICNAHKPAKENYQRGMRMMGTNASNTLFVGDQLFTDVYGAKKTGITSYLTRPIDPKEEVQIVLKRHLEKIILHFYEKDIHKTHQTSKM